MLAAQGFEFLNNIIHNVRDICNKKPLFYILLNHCLFSEEIRLKHKLLHHCSFVFGNCLAVPKYKLLCNPVCLVI